MAHLTNIQNFKKLRQKIIYAFQAVDVNQLHKELTYRLETLVGCPLDGEHLDIRVR